MDKGIPCSERHGATPRTKRVALRDGGHVLIRRLRAADRPGVVALLAGLSPLSRAGRFHSAGVHLTAEVIDQVTAGHVLVATREGGVVALASYHPRCDDMEAEVALVVADAEQRRGIGSALCMCLLREARCAGIRWIWGEIAGSNRGMLTLLHRLDLPLTYTRAPGVIAIRIALLPDPSPALAPN
jgi:GNAT superfamily N-acetyltransferase